MSTVPVVTTASLPKVSGQILTLMPEVVPVSVTTNRYGISTIEYASLEEHSTPNITFPIDMPFIFGRASQDLFENRAYSKVKMDHNQLLGYGPDLFVSLRKFSELAKMVTYEICDAHFDGGYEIREKVIKERVSGKINRKAPYDYLRAGLYLAHSADIKTRTLAHNYLTLGARLFVGGLDFCSAALTYELSAWIAESNAQFIARSRSTEKNAGVSSAKLLDDVRNYSAEAATCWGGSFLNTTDNKMNSRRTRAYRGIFDKWAAGEMNGILRMLFVSHELHEAEGDKKQAADDLMRIAFFSSLKAEKNSKPIITKINLQKAYDIYKDLGEPEIILKRLFRLIGSI